MKSNKLPYSKPELVNYGDIQSITQQGGISVTDVPLGTPTTPPGDVTSVAS